MFVEFNYKPRARHPSRQPLPQYTSSTRDHGTRPPLYRLLCWLRAAVRDVVARVGLVAFCPSLSSSDRVALPSTFPFQLPFRITFLIGRAFRASATRRFRGVVEDVRGFSFARRRARRRHERHGDHPPRRGLDLTLRGCGIRSLQPQAPVVEHRSAEWNFRNYLSRRRAPHARPSPPCRRRRCHLHNQSILRCSPQRERLRQGASLPCLRKTNDPS